MTRVQCSLRFWILLKNSEFRSRLQAGFLADLISARLYVAQHGTMRQRKMVFPSTLLPSFLPSFQWRPPATNIPILPGPCLYSNSEQSDKHHGRIEREEREREGEGRGGKGEADFLERI